MSLRKYLLGSVAVCGSLALVAPAHAQSSGQLNSQIRTLQDEVRALNQQLQNLQSQVVQTQRNAAVTSETVQEIKSAPAPKPAADSVIVKMINGEPVFSTADGQNTLAITGRLHLDVGAYDWHPNSTATSPRNLDSGVNARRARLGVQGKFLGDWGYALIYDFGGSNDVGGSGGSGGIENAFLRYDGIPNFHVVGGYIDVPYSLDESISSNNIMFMEKSLAGDTATGIAGNDNRAAFGATWNSDRAWVGVFGTGPTSGTTHAIGTGGTNAVQFGATGRATFQVLQAPDYSFHIGADAEGLIKPPRSSAFGAVTLKDDPELRVDNTALISTGTIGTALNPVTGASVFGGEVAGGFGSLYGQGEYFHFNVARQGQPDLDFNGGYGEVSYTLTGEARKYSAGCGCYGGISPAHPFVLGSGWGAWEIAARYSVLDLNDSTSVAPITGGKETNVTLGLNWYPNNNMRFMLNYIHGDVSKTQTAAPTDIGGTMNAIALRSQFAF
jgi:phosphate-selective porin OprO and OprP